MYPLKRSTALAILIFAHDADGNAVTGKIDGDWTKRISKNGSTTFAAMTVTITEAENGWYGLTISTSHSDTDGILSMTFNATGIKQINLQYRVQANLNDDLAAYIDTEIAAIKAKTDQLVFTTANRVDSTVMDKTGFSLSTAGIQAIWDVLTSALATANSIGKLIVDNLNAAISTRATPAQVNTEVLDVLTVDTFGELSNVPTASSTILSKLSWLFMLGRNKVTQTSTTQTLRNDADVSSIATAALSDDTVTGIRGEWT